MIFIDEMFYFTKRICYKKIWINFRSTFIRKLSINLKYFFEKISKHMIHFNIQNFIIYFIQNVTLCVFDVEKTYSQIKLTSIIFGINVDWWKIKYQWSIFSFWRQLFSHIFWKYNKFTNKCKKNWKMISYIEKIASI